MERFVFFLVAIAAALLLIRLIPHLPFVTERETEAGRPTMSQAELRFYQVLLRCIPAGYEVWAKPNLGDYTDRAVGYVDFLITKGSDREPALIVDFDDTPIGVRSEATRREYPFPILSIAMEDDYLAPVIRNRIQAALGDPGLRLAA